MGGRSENRLGQIPQLGGSGLRLDFEGFLNETWLLSGLDLSSELLCSEFYDLQSFQGSEDCPSCLKEKDRYEKRLHQKDIFLEVKSECSVSLWYLGVIFSQLMVLIFNINNALLYLEFCLYCFGQLWFLYCCGLVKGRGLKIK